MVMVPGKRRSDDQVWSAVGNRRFRTCPSEGSCCRPVCIPASKTGLSVFGFLSVWWSLWKLCIENSIIVPLLVPSYQLSTYGYRIFFYCVQNDPILTSQLTHTFVSSKCWTFLTNFCFYCSQLAVWNLYQDFGMTLLFLDVCLRQLKLRLLIVLKKWMKKWFTRPKWRLISN